MAIPECAGAGGTERTSTTWPISFVRKTVAVAITFCVSAGVTNWGFEGASLKVSLPFTSEIRVHLQLGLQHVFTRTSVCYNEVTMRSSSGVKPATASGPG